MDKPPIWEYSRREILETRYKEQAAHLRDLNQYDLRVVGGFFTIQLILTSWFVTHPPGNWWIKSTIIIVDHTLWWACYKIMISSEKRRDEIRDTIVNINEAFGLYTPGNYLPGKPINPPPPEKKKFIWYDVVCGIGVACVVLALLLSGGGACLME